MATLTHHFLPVHHVDAILARVILAVGAVGTVEPVVWGVLHGSVTDVTFGTVARPALVVEGHVIGCGDATDNTSFDGVVVGV